MEKSVEEALVVELAVSQQGTAVGDQSWQADKHGEEAAPEPDPGDFEGSAAAGMVLSEVEKLADRQHGITEVGDQCWLNRAELKQDTHSRGEAAADDKEVENTKIIKTSEEAKDEEFGNASGNECPGPALQIVGIFGENR